MVYASWGRERRVVNARTSKKSRAIGYRTNITPKTVLVMAPLMIRWSPAKYKTAYMTGTATVAMDEICHNSFSRAVGKWETHAMQWMPPNNSPIPARMYSLVLVRL